MDAHVGGFAGGAASGEGPRVGGGAGSVLGLPVGRVGAGGGEDVRLGDEPLQGEVVGEESGTIFGFVWIGRGRFLGVSRGRSLRGAARVGGT